MTRLWIGYLPFIPVGVPLANLRGQTQDGFDFQRMLDVALRREFQRPLDWAAYAFVGCTTWASGVQPWWLWKKLIALLAA